MTIQSIEELVTAHEEIEKHKEYLSKIVRFCHNFEILKTNATKITEIAAIEKKRFAELSAKGASYSFGQYEATCGYSNDLIITLSINDLLNTVSEEEREKVERTILVSITPLLAENISNDLADVLQFNLENMFMLPAFMVDLVNKTKSERQPLDFAGCFAYKTENSSEIKLKIIKISSTAVITNKSIETLKNVLLNYKSHSASIYAHNVSIEVNSDALIASYRMVKNATGNMVLPICVQTSPNSPKAKFLITIPITVNGVNAIDKLSPGAYSSIMSQLSQQSQTLVHEIDKAITLLNKYDDLASQFKLANQQLEG